MYIYAYLRSKTAVESIYVTCKNYREKTEKKKCFNFFMVLINKHISWMVNFLQNEVISNQFTLSVFDYSKNGYSSYMV